VAHKKSDFAVERFVEIQSWWEFILEFLKIDILRNSERAKRGMKR
jgi:hypothetical protein